jgi:hypothetical protein
VNERHLTSARRRIAIVLVLASIIAAAVTGEARTATIRVGKGETVSRIADAARLAHDGDTIEILSGEYRGDVAVWTQTRLTLRGVGARPVFVADNQSAEGKAIWVFRNGDYVVENIAFTGARVPDRNGAGIRFERGRLIVRHCSFTDNENGILAGGDADSELTVEDSEFSNAPRDGGPLMHLLYVGAIGRFNLTGSRFHQGFEGHLVKSRARENHIRYNLLYDGMGGKTSYELEFPNGGVAFVVGNVIGQGSDTTNPVVVAFGAEGTAYANNALYLAHNTLLSDRVAGGWFLRVWREKLPANTEVLAINNLTVGLGIFSLVNRGTFDGNYPVMSMVLGDPSSLDFTLGSHSLLRGRGIEPPVVGGYSLAPSAEFRLPVGTQPITRPTAWTPGAFQTTDPRR